MESRLVSYDLFKAIAHPCRREMLFLIARGEASVAQVMEGLVARHQMTRPAVAKHLGLLLRTGLLSESWRGREHVYRMVAGRLREITRWVEAIEGEAAVGVGGPSVPEPAVADFAVAGLAVAGLASVEAFSDPVDRGSEALSDARATSDGVNIDVGESIGSGSGSPAKESRDEADRSEREWQVW